MISEEVRVDKIIPNKLCHFTSNLGQNSLLGFPSIIHRLCEAIGVFIENEIPISIGKLITKKIIERVKVAPSQGAQEEEISQAQEEEILQLLLPQPQAPQGQVEPSQQPLLLHNKR